MKRQPPDKKPEKKPKKISAITVAAWLNITDTRVRQLVNEGVLPGKDPERGYPIKACIHAYIAYLQTLAQQRGGKNLSEKRERNLDVRTDREEVKYLKEIGQLVAYADVMRLFTLIVGTYRDNRRGTATRIAPTLSEEVVKRCKQTFTAALAGTEEKTRTKLQRLLESEINESRLRDKLTELLKEKINAETNAHLTELADEKLIRDAFPLPMKRQTDDRRTDNHSVILSGAKNPDQRKRRKK